jgi:aspartate/methionine/tyrosine aminotransferase
MKYASAYLDWYVRVPKVKYDLRSSGLTGFKYDLNLGQVDLSVNYGHGGNPETTNLLAERYKIKPENIFITSEGASGISSRIIRFIAEKNKSRNEAVVEYPTYEPLLRFAQEHFPVVKRFERKAGSNYEIDVKSVAQATSSKTGLLVLTNPHAPSATIADRENVKKIQDLARERGFYVLCDEIYAEFNRAAVPIIFSADSDRSIVTTSFTKAYGLGGLKLGIAVLDKELVKDLYRDVLNTIGNSANVIQMVATELLKNLKKLEEYADKWKESKTATEKWLDENDLRYFPNKSGVTYWVETPIDDTYKWVNESVIPDFNLALVPGAHFLFKNDYEVIKSNMMRIGLGALSPSEHDVQSALETLRVAMCQPRP